MRISDHFKIKAIYLLYIYVTVCLVSYIINRFGEISHLVDHTEPQNLCYLVRCPLSEEICAPQVEKFEDTRIKSPYSIPFPSPHCEKRASFYNLNFTKVCYSLA
jgi:hypothetical protein